MFKVIRQQVKATEPKDAPLTVRQKAQKKYHICIQSQYIVILGILRFNFVCLLKQELKS